MRDMSKWHYCPSADEGVHLFGRPPFTGQLGDPQPGGDAVDVDIVKKGPVKGPFLFSGGERGIDSSLRSSPLRGASGVQTGCAGLSNRILILVPPSIRK